MQPTTLAGVNVPGPAEMALVAAGARLPVGNWGADGVIDELRFYDEPIVP